MKEIVLGHRILLKMEEIKAEDTLSTGGIIIEAVKRSTKAEDSEIGIVVGIGSTAYKEQPTGEPWVQIGDRVVIARYNGLLVPHDKTLRIVNEDDVLLRIEE